MKKNTKKLTKLAAVLSALLLAMSCFVGVSCSNGSDDDSTPIENENGSGTGDDKKPVGGDDN